MNAEAIAELLANQTGLLIGLPLARLLTRYLALLLQWNARMNLTAHREPEAIALRHFGESLQCAHALPEGIRTQLDFGSGAGFPGAICALTRPEIAVTLAESQGKKAAFLREACRQVPIPAAVHAGRVEALAADRRFDVVTLRAVDRMATALKQARQRVNVGGWLAIMTTEDATMRFRHDGFTPTPSTIALRGTERKLIALYQRHEDTPK